MDLEQAVRVVRTFYIDLARDNSPVTINRRRAALIALEKNKYHCLDRATAVRWAEELAFLAGNFESQVRRYEPVSRFLSEDSQLCLDACICLITALN